MRTLPTFAVLLALPLALVACTTDYAPADPDTVVVDEDHMGDDHMDDTHADDPVGEDHADDGHLEAGHMDDDHVMDEDHTDDAHMDDSPHGGTVKEAGDGHLELVVAGSALMVYPLDDMAEPIPVAAIQGARVVLHPQTGSEQTLPLEVMGDHLMATVPAGMTAYSADVSVPVADETRRAHFDVGLDGDSDHAH